MTAQQVAVVTGGGRGIGAAVSRRLAADGLAVVVNYSRSSGQAQAVVRQIQAAGGQALAVRADISRPAQAEQLISTAAERLGPPTVLVNNAGVNDNASARSLGPARWNHVIGVNLNGAYYCTHAALPAMYQAGWGRIIYLGSPSAARSITPTMTAYAAAKAGLAAMAAVLATEVARRGITVNTVIPGYVDTDMVRSAAPRTTDIMTATWPQIPADAVAAAVSFLVSDQAAYISGEQLGVWHGGPITH
jgi:3-oxoacyl-[acyl-carrier protein] reductase